MVVVLVYLYHHIAREILTHIVVCIVDSLNGGSKNQKYTPVLKGSMTYAPALWAVVPER